MSLSDEQALRRLRRDPDAIVVIYDRHVARLVAAPDRRARDRLGIAAVAFDEEAIHELIRRVDAEALHDALAEALAELPLEQREAVVGRVVLGRAWSRSWGS